MNDSVTLCINKFFSGSRILDTVGNGFIVSVEGTWSKFFCFSTIKIIPCF